ncbi:hypothetical protein IGB42_04122 [Andreprevotia sp. IGB-42]|uniref:glycosyltransferase n=1 Tax=Andreprevotia sp. IGB-42 TaxID=2497473 RepID=UPI00135686F6|nr:glycosyltransferase [Andreprevotia sp. IGB-42]KAF0811423.1 hypothetical protein IGB42_04122 [Andreprevotia sp. IGB-42]
MATVYLLAADKPAATLATLEDCLAHSVQQQVVTLVVSADQLSALRALPAASAMLDSPGVRILDAGGPLTCARLAEQGDLLLLAGGVRLPHTWDVRLAGAVAASPGFATLSACCRGFALHQPDFKQPEDELALLDRILLNESTGMAWTVPVASPVCLYLRAEWCARARGLQADLRQLQGRVALGQTLQLLGGSHGLSDVLLLDWPGDALDFATPPQLEARVRAFEHANPLRYRVLGELPLPDALLDGRPVQLHVMHSWGGGLERWVHDYCDATPDRQNLILKSIGSVGLYGQRLALFLDITHGEPVRVWDFADGICATAQHHHEYAAAIREIIQTYLVDSVIVSSLIGHSLDVLRTGLPTLHVWHEFYPYCPALYIHFGGTCRSCTPDRLAACTASNPINNLFRSVLPAEWLSLRSAYLDTVRTQQVRLIAPSQSVIDHYGELEPALLALAPQVIPHGMAWSPAAVPVPAAHVAGGKLKLVVLGALTEHKGLKLFEALLPQITAHAEVILLGCGESGAQFANKRGITVIPRYKRQALPALLAELAPDAGLLMSIWPETFSYTLSELMCAGIPPIAPAHGAYPERVIDGSNGFLCEPTAASYAGVIRRLHADPALLAVARSGLGAQAHRSCAEMASDYAALLPRRALQGGFMPVARSFATKGVALGLANAFPDSMRQAMFNAHGFLRIKLATTPRLKRWQRRLAGWGLELTMSMIYRLWRLISRERWQ